MWLGVKREREKWEHLTHNDTFTGSDRQKLAALWSHLQLAIDLVEEHFPNMSAHSKADWAINITLAPEFFCDPLKDRTNNIILVSALLLTISAPSLFSPPQFQWETFDEFMIDEAPFRVYTYFMALATLCFLLSIFSGVAFIDNAMSRAYTQKGRVQLIIRSYWIREVSVWGLSIGALCLIGSFGPLAMGVFVTTDIIVFTVACVVVLVIFFVLWYFAVVGGNKHQRQITLFFLEHVIHLRGQTLTLFEQPQVESQIEMKEMPTPEPNLPAKDETNANLLRA